MVVRCLWVFRCSGFRVKDLGLRGLGLRVKDLLTLLTTLHESLN